MPSGSRLRVGDQTSWWENAGLRNMSQRGWAPRPPVEQRRRTGKKRLWQIEWGSICCNFVRSPTPSHSQPFQIKWEVYFSKNIVVRRYFVVVFCIEMYVYYEAIQHWDWKQVALFTTTSLCANKWSISNRIVCVR